MDIPLYKFAWLVTAFIGWGILLVLVDWSRLKYTVWGGVITVMLQLIVDTGAIHLQLYQVEGIFYILTSSLFFTVGIAFTIGILIAQTMPSTRSLQAVNILVITALFSLEEFLYIKVGVLEYVNWNQPASVFVNLLVFTSFTWLVDSMGLNRAGRQRKGGYRL